MLRFLTAAVISAVFVYAANSAPEPKAVQDISVDVMMSGGAGAGVAMRLEVR